MSLLLSVDEARETASDHHVRVIQHGIEPAPGGQQGLETSETAKCVQPADSCFNTHKFC